MSTDLSQVVGLKRTMLSCLVLLTIETGLATFTMPPWRLLLTWGLTVNIGPGAFGFAGTVASRWC